MGDFLAELKRRHIYGVAGAYAVVAWGLLQLVNDILPIMQAPVWAGQFCLLLLALGFPIALLFAWMRELPSSESTSAQKTTAMDFVLVGVLVAVLLAVIYEQWAPTFMRQQAGLEAARAAAAKPAGISVAVLPFVNLSSDKEQEFFSDGITEEITTALTKVPDLRVVARTSAFEFKGKSINIKTVGEELGATHVIEGSVRKAGDRVRITVQLITADNGTHLWAEDYDRQLTDIFQIQEDIARTIASSLRMPLGLKPNENLINNRSIGADDYQQFLRARALLQGRQLPDTITVLEGIVARNPTYAPAWAILANAYSLAPNRSPERNGSAQDFRRVVDAYFAKADAANQRAIQLDPNLPDAYAQMSNQYRARGKQIEAEDNRLRAAALDPGMAISHGRALGLEAVGRVKDALAIREQLQTIEPFVPLYKNALTGVLWVNGRNDDAIAMAKTLVPDVRGITLARIYASMGRYGEAADALTEAASFPGMSDAVRLLRSAPAKADAPEKLPPLGTLFAWAYLAVGAESRVLDNYETLLDGGRLPGAEMGWLWHPMYSPVRKTERFKTFARKAGLVAYWRAKGWPEQCHPTTADDFACE